MESAAQHGAGAGVGTAPRSACKLPLPVPPPPPKSPQPKSSHRFGGLFSGWRSTRSQEVSNSSPAPYTLVTNQQDDRRVQTKRLFSEVLSEDIPDHIADMDDMAIEECLSQRECSSPAASAAATPQMLRPPASLPPQLLPQPLPLQSPRRHWHCCHRLL